MKTLMLCLLSLCCLTTFAQEQVIKLYEGTAPGSENWKQKEAENNNNMWRTRIVYNVTSPTLTVFKADVSKANGTAVVICPGGGFHALSIDSEGFDVARWLAARGVTCLVLKYRLIESKTDDPTKEIMTKDPQKFQEEVKLIVQLAMQDALKAVSYVRQHAQEYGINPERIGVMGFSAGGTVTASVAYNYTAESKPAFVAPIYLQYDWVAKKEVPADAPPMFILAASDDALGLAPHSVRLYNDWLAAKEPVELHLLTKGGHGFGMRKQNLPSDNWIQLFAYWLEGIGLMKK